MHIPSSLDAAQSDGMAGGRVKPGITYGETDDFNYNVVKNPVSVHEMNATTLHLMGIDHSRLPVKYQGLDVCLTGFA